MNKVLITLIVALFCVSTGLEARRRCRSCRPCCRPCTTQTVNCSGNSCAANPAAQAVAKKVYSSGGCASGRCSR